MNQEISPRQKNSKIYYNTTKWKQDELLDDLNAHELYFEMTAEVKTYFSLHDQEETFAIVEKP